MTAPVQSTRADFSSLADSHADLLASSRTNSLASSRAGLGNAARSSSSRSALNDAELAHSTLNPGAPRTSGWAHGSGRGTQARRTESQTGSLKTSARGAQNASGSSSSRAKNASSAGQPRDQETESARTGRTNKFSSAVPTSQDDEGDDSTPDFQAILREFASGPNDDENDAQSGSGRDSKQQSGSDAGNGSQTALDSNASTPTVMKDALPFEFSFSRVGDALGSGFIARAKGTAASSPSSTEPGAASGIGASLNALAIAPDGAQGISSIEEDHQDRGTGYASAAPLETSQVSSSAPGAPAGELAFAARLMQNADAAAKSKAQDSSGEAQNDSGDPAQKSTAIAQSAVPAAQQSASGADASSEKTASAVLDASSKAVASFSADATAPNSAALEIQGDAASKFETHSTPANADHQPATARLGESIEPSTVPKSPQASNADITVRIADAGRGADLRFVERGGEVHVSVRTSDAEMAQTLRGGLNDLASRLEHGGISAEMWRPAAASTENGSQNGSGSQHDSADDRSGGGRGSQQDHSGANDSDGRNQNSPRPKWVEALETSIGRQG